MAHLTRLGYRNAREKLAERFHVSEQLLRLLNPKTGFRKADTTLNSSSPLPSWKSTLTRSSRAPPQAGQFSGGILENSYRVSNSV